MGMDMGTMEHTIDECLEEIKFGTLDRAMQRYTKAYSHCALVIRS